MVCVAIIWALAVNGSQTSNSAQPQPASSPGPASSIALPSPGYRFRAGQTFTYTVDWRLVNAGSTTVRLDTVNGLNHVTTNADSTGAVALLYHIHDRLESYFDPRTNCSLSLTRHTEEGFRRIESKVRYDYSQRKSILDESNVRAKNQKHQENDIPSCVTDVISSIYYVASQNLQPGSKFIFPINDGGKTADIQVSVEAREKLKVPAGEFDTIRVSAQALNGPQKGKGEVWMWYSDDDRRLPVQMRARAFWGTLVFHLAQITGVDSGAKPGTAKSEAK
jgi:hypothetical protein